MRLSRLHIAGFKSFPDRAELGFDEGVTAIVGPNGCGKSNVVDAITWVLGEQSVKSLRGERMEDVIFNGSDARKPTASAEVRLKLSQVARRAMAAATSGDESLDDEPLLTRDVEIGRRLYRSGESEYLIDGEVCRLRDVHDLLMDSGLGVKAYAVIEQGKIGQILSSRPAERRTLIEEAAGVTKYKSRRRAAELKLEAAQQNLTRVDDIIFEVEKQRGALRRQAARARRYRKLREELRTWEQVQFARRHEAIAREMEAADRRLTEARERTAAAAAHVAELESALEAVRLALTESEAGATASRERAHAIELEIGRWQQQASFDRQQIEDLGRQAAAFGAEVQDLAARREPAMAALEAQREAARLARQTLETARADVATCESAYAAALAAVQVTERESDAIRATVLAATTTLAALRQAREHASTSGDRVAAELERLGVESRELSAELDRLTTAHADRVSALADGRSGLEQAIALREAASRTLAAHRADEDRLSHALSAAQREAAAKEGRLRSLEDLEASRATFGDAARLLLQDGGRLGHHGAVADHLDVERSFERAVDALLGDRLQYVLVDRAEDVATGLAILADRQAGRCGFLVLDVAAGPPSDQAAPVVVPPGTRALSSVVRSVGPYGDRVARVVDRALVADSFEAARAVAALVSVPVAAMTGEVFRGPSLVEGGSRPDVRGILETRAEVLALREDLQALGLNVSDLERDAAAAALAIDESDRRLVGLVADEREREKTIVALEAQVSRAADDELRVRRRLEVVATERQRAIEEQQGIEARRDEATRAIATHESDQQTAEMSLGGVLSRLQVGRDDVEARLRFVTDSRTREATLVERVSALDLDVVRLEEASRELDARVSARAADIRRTEDRQRELRAAVAETERRLDESVATFRELEVEIRSLDERVVTHRTEFAEREHAIRGARHVFEGLRSEATDLEVSRARAAADLAHLESACMESVGTSLAEVAALVARLDEEGRLVPPVQRAVPSADEDEVDAADTAGAVEPSAALEGDVNPDAVVALLRARIERLGPVNMMAIEQFDELESRHTFLSTQRRDLVDSIAQTGEAIRKIDRTTRERFAEAFESINRNFEGTFTTLFGGGRAGLVMIDQENDTESGIDIIAQPPGKRLQNVQLLSGGEKALTAMALMFAIFKYRPSPFCLLDEIDAPLDDANIGRFVEMLQGMQTHTQFILITHNRKTMEIANRLYGVTMEEPGVSKLISVQLN